MPDRQEGPAPYFPPPGGSYYGPPLTGEPTAEYAQQPGYPSPYGHPAYGAPPAYGPPPPYGYPAPYGYPPAYGQPAYGQPGYGYGYPPPGAQRPGLALAAAVLSYINSGLLILAGAILIFFASAVDAFARAFGGDNDYSTELTLDGLINLIAAGLLIGGAVSFTGRGRTGRLLCAVGNAIVVVLSIYWLTRFDFDNDGSNADGYLFYAVLFGTLAVLPLIFMFTTGVNRWLQDEKSGA